MNKNFLQTEHQVSVYNFEDVLASRYANAKELSSQLLATCYFHEDEFPLYMHAHSFYEINVVTSGEGIHYIGNNNLSAMPGKTKNIPLPSAPDLLSWLTWGSLTAKM